MQPHYRDIRKIDPAKGSALEDGTPNDNDRVEIGPTQLAFREWEASGLARCPTCRACASTAGNG